MTEFLLIFTFLFTTASGDTRGQTFVPAKFSTMKECLKVRRGTSGLRQEMAHKIARARNRAVKHVFGSCVKGPAMGPGA